MKSLDYTLYIYFYWCISYFSSKTGAHWSEGFVLVIKTPINKQWSKLLKIQNGEDPTLFIITDITFCATSFRRKSPKQNKTINNQWKQRKTTTRNCEMSNWTQLVSFFLAPLELILESFDIQISYTIWSHPSILI